MGDRSVSISLKFLVESLTFEERPLEQLGPGLVGIERLLGSFLNNFGVLGNHLFYIFARVPSLV